VIDTITRSTWLAGTTGIVFAGAACHAGGRGVEFLLALDRVSAASCLQAPTATDWRTHWRTGTKSPANRQFQSGLENR
jgi:hypothetical protein